MLDTFNKAFDHVLTPEKFGAFGALPKPLKPLKCAPHNGCPPVQAMASAFISSWVYAIVIAPAYMCVYGYVLLSLCVCIRPCVCMFGCVYVTVCVTHRLEPLLFVCMYCCVHVSTHVFMDVYMPHSVDDVCMLQYVCVYVCMDVWMYVCVYVCMCGYVYVCMCV